MPHAALHLALSHVRTLSVSKDARALGNFFSRSHIHCGVWPLSFCLSQWASSFHSQRLNGRWKRFGKIVKHAKQLICCCAAVIRYPFTDCRVRRFYRLSSQLNNFNCVFFFSSVLFRFFFCSFTFLAIIRHKSKKYFARLL